jgi:uncharacterized membrane protein YfcA
MMRILLAALTGIVGGTASGLFGIGGGVIMVPAFVFFFGEDIKKAIGTSLLIIVPTAIVGASKYLIGKDVDWRIASDWRLFAVVMACAVVGGFIGPEIARKIYAVDRGVLLARLFGIFLVLVGIELIVFGPLNQLKMK